MYQQVHRLLALIDVNLSLLDSDLATYARKARRGRTASEALSIVTSQYTRTRRNRDVVLPELSVVSAWVIVLKMAYGLDGRPRQVVPGLHAELGALCLQTDLLLLPPIPWSATQSRRPSSKL